MSEEHWREQAHLANVDWVATEVKLSEAREALRKAKHALTCVHGLWAHDRDDRSEKMPLEFQIDTLRAVEAIEAVLGEE